MAGDIGRRGKSEEEARELMLRKGRCPQVIMTRK
jgi:hypothetical protein